MIEKHVEHYRIIEKIGEGGMGEVFVAWDETLQRQVALKSIRRSHRLDDMARMRFMREARTLSSLDHPGVCRIFDYLRSSDGDFLVLELIEGRSLDTVMRKRLPRAQALDIAQQLAAVLTAAHEAGIVHRDLKPSNVMVTPDGTVKVLDFGLSSREGVQESHDSGEHNAETGQLVRDSGSEGAAESAESEYGLEESTRWTKPGVVMGTIHYMSPEQARGETVTTSTDVFAFGLILQELLSGDTGHPLYLEARDLIDRAARGTIDLSPQLNREMSALVRSLTRAVPEARPTAAAVFERLGWIRGRNKRVLKRSLALGLLLIGSLAWLKYTIDLRRREQQAEEVLEYLLVDLREQLVPLGRLDILADIGRKAIDYFEPIPARHWTDEELTRRCQAFHQLGDVLSQQGDRVGAMEFFQPALELARELVRRDPSNLDWLFQRGQLEFYVGNVSFDLNDYDSARPYFEAYLATSRALLDYASNNRGYRIELAYALTNLGALELRQTRLAEAQAAFAEVVAMWRGMVEEAPEEIGLRAELADVLSWSAASVVDLDVRRAITFLRQEFEIREELRRVDPENKDWVYLYSTGLHHYAKALAQAAEYEEARAKRARAVSLARELSAQDRSNAEWRRLLGVALTEYGNVLLLLNHDKEARKVASEAMDVLAALRDIDPANNEWRARGSAAHLLHARILVAEKRYDDALATTSNLLEMSSRGAVDASYLGDILLVHGDSLAGLGRDQDSRGSWDRALAHLSRPDLLESVDRGELRAKILARVGRNDEAAGILEGLEASGRRIPALRQTLEEAGVLASR